MRQRSAARVNFAPPRFVRSAWSLSKEQQVFSRSPTAHKRQDAALYRLIVVCSGSPGCNVLLELCSWRHEEMHQFGLHPHFNVLSAVRTAGQFLWGWDSLKQVPASAF